MASGNLSSNFFPVEICISIMKYVVRGRIIKHSGEWMTLNSICLLIRHVRQ
jgi:hypothetical protein